MKLSIFAFAITAMIWLSGCASDVKSKEADTALSAEQVGDHSGGEPVATAENTPGTPEHLTKSGFLAKVYDYEKNPKDWVFSGDKPCIVDFYADWCRPCKMIAPILSELAGQYEGQIRVYKINVDEEKELAQYFGIQSIPTILFCPMNGKPQMAQGALPKETFEKAINEVLLGNKSSN